MQYNLLAIIALYDTQAHVLHSIIPAWRLLTNRHCVNMAEAPRFKGTKDNVTHMPYAINAI